jgi:hypothetical protein
MCDKKRHIWSVPHASSIIKQYDAFSAKEDTSVKDKEANDSGSNRISLPKITGCK